MSDIGGCCKILAKIYGVIGAIGSIVLANIYGKESEVNYYFERVEYQQNWELTIAIFVGVLLVVSMICIALYTIGAIYFYCINNFYAATPVSWSVVVVEYCLITIAPDFILCVLATAFSLKLRPVFLGMMHEYSMDRKVV